MNNGKGNKPLALVVFAILMVSWMVVMGLQLWVIRRVWFLSLALVLVPFAIAWRIASHRRRPPARSPSSWTDV
ncbi:MAG: hypothetical protein KF764_25965 [Labilithrix sp.]|nr:hypothetical protein [Labilithrix sp.]